MAKKRLRFKENLACLLAYAFGPFAILSGLFIFANEERSRLVRFHALQAVFFSIVWLVMQFTIALLLLFSPRFMRLFLSLLNLFGVAVWLLLMTRAYQGRFFLLPVLGRLAMDNVESAPGDEGRASADSGDSPPEERREGGGSPAPPPEKPAGASRGRRGASSRARRR